MHDVLLYNTRYRSYYTPLGGYYLKVIPVFPFALPKAGACKGEGGRPSSIKDSLRLQDQPPDSSKETAQPASCPKEVSSTSQLLKKRCDI
jgi:hypothetical protein